MSDREIVIVDITAPPVVEQIRALLLSVPAVERPEVLYNVHICTRCGDDLRLPNGTRSPCFCWNDE